MKSDDDNDSGFDEREISMQACCMEFVPESGWDSGRACERFLGYAETAKSLSLL